MKKATGISVLQSRFKRNGGETDLTRIVSEENTSEYTVQLEGLEFNEKGVIVYRKDDNNWVLLTQKRLIAVKDGTRLELLYEDIANATYAMQEEAQEGPGSFKGMSKVALNGKNGMRYVAQLEPGRGFSGVFAALTFAVG